VRRRDLITLLGGGAAAWPLAAWAQQAPKSPIIGYLGQSTAAAETQRLAAFVQRLRELGWIDGRNFAIEIRWTEGRDAVACNTKRREMSADRVGDIAGRKVRVVLLRHRVSAWPSCSAITPIGTPRMASIEP
jgi:hypothetical protein